MAPPPAVVLVHGAWHTPWHYQTLAADLAAHDAFLVRCPPLPSQQTRLPLPIDATLDSDVKLVRSEIQALAAQGYRIVVVAHSYGGVVATAAVEGLILPKSNSSGAEASDKGGDKDDGSRGGNPGGVVHVVYVSAFVIPVGTSLATPFGGALPPWLDEDVENKTCTMQNARYSFYNDIEAGDIVDANLAQVVHCPASVCRDPLPAAPYEAMERGDLDATFLVCRSDVNMPPKAAEGMATLLGKHRSIKYLDAGHCPMASQPHAVANIVREAWEASKARLKI